MAAWPLPVRAQQSERMRRIGVLMAYSSNDREGQARTAAFVLGLGTQNWHEGNNLRIVMPDASTLLHRDTIVDLAVRYRLPAVYPYRYFAELGGLMSYGIDANDGYKRSASYVDRILQGAKPADLPVQLPTKFELVINLKTAKALGLTIPPTLLATADEVIE